MLLVGDLGINLKDRKMNSVDLSESSIFAKINTLSSVHHNCIFNSFREHYLNFYKIIGRRVVNLSDNNISYFELIVSSELSIPIVYRELLPGNGILSEYILSDELMKIRAIVSNVNLDNAYQHSALVTLIKELMDKAIDDRDPNRYYYLLQFVKIISCLSINYTTERYQNVINNIINKPVLMEKFIYDLPISMVVDLYNIIHNYQTIRIREKCITETTFVNSYCPVNNMELYDIYKDLLLIPYTEYTVMLSENGIEIENKVSYNEWFSTMICNNIIDSNIRALMIKLSYQYQPQFKYISITKTIDEYLLISYTDINGQIYSYVLDGVVLSLLTPHISLPF